jgi:hypothetical protein
MTCHKCLQLGQVIMTCHKCLQLGQVIMTCYKCLPLGQIIMTCHKCLHLGPKCYEIYTLYDKNIIILILVQGFKLTLHSLSF